MEPLAEIEADIQDAITQATEKEREKLNITQAKRLLKAQLQ
jgi:hypothetical protein